MKNRFLAIFLAFAAWMPMVGQVNVQGTGIQIGGTTSTGGVTSLNGLANAVILACNPPFSCSVAGNTITIGSAAAFSITSFTGCSTVELGTSLVNPSFTAGYSVTPVSAQITNTQGIGSPLYLTTPFTSGTVTGTFVHTTIASTVFTLSATQGTTQTSSCTDSWQPRIFGGYGTVGATSSVTASGTTAVLSNGTSLGSVQLGAETVGQTFGPYCPTSQAVYLLLQGGSHTFVDANTGFPFAMNAPITVTFTNSQGTVETKYLYQSTNPLTCVSGPGFAPKVAS